LRYYQWKICHE